MDQNVQIKGEVNAGWSSYWNKDIGKKYHSMTETDKIIEAADRFDEVGYEEAEKVAEKAEVSKHEVLRIWDENDIDIQGLHPNVKLYWDDLTDTQISELSYYHYNKGKIDELFDSEAELFRTIGQLLDREQYAVRDTVKAYKWLLKDDYRPTWLVEDEYWIDEETIQKLEAEEIVDEMEDDEDDILMEINMNDEDYEFETPSSDGKSPVYGLNGFLKQLNQHIENANELREIAKELDGIADVMEVIYDKFDEQGTIKLIIEFDDE